MTASSLPLGDHRSHVLEQARRRLALVLPSCGSLALSALGEIGPSQGTHAWPREDADPFGYSEARLASWAGCCIRTMRDGLRVLEELRILRTTWRTGHVNRYQLVPSRLLELANMAIGQQWAALRGVVQRAIATALQRERATAEAHRADPRTPVRGSRTMRERLKAESLAALTRLEAGLLGPTRARVTGRSEAALASLPSEEGEGGADDLAPLPGWLLGALQGRSTEGAEVVVDALAVLLPLGTDADRAELAPAAVACWESRRGSSDLADDVRALTRALSEAPELAGVAKRVAGRRGLAVLLDRKGLGERIRKARVYLAQGNRSPDDVLDRRWLAFVHGEQAAQVQAPASSTAGSFADTLRSMWGIEPPGKQRRWLDQARAELGAATTEADVEARAVALYVDSYERAAR